MKRAYLARPLVRAPGGPALISILYLLFFLSGAAALVYEVAWSRSLSLVFGGSHLAVTTVLAVYMGGLALGSKLFGKLADRSRRPLRLYGLLELGIGLFALVFIGLARIYPSIYVPLARLAEESRTWLTFVRVAFAAVALIAPTTLMGGTLPVMTRFVAREPGKLGRRLSLLYGLNTLGAVVGSLAAGFFLLRSVGVTASMLLAVAANLLVGLVALALPQPAGAERAGAAPAPAPEAAPAGERVSATAERLVLWGIGVSGFCALGYEVLWTRMLSFAVGTSTYSFTIILVSFLAGIALGSQAYGLAHGRGWWGFGKLHAGPQRMVVGFGAVQLAVGAAALAVTALMRDLPWHATRLQGALLGTGAGEFGARQAATFAVALIYLFVPAFFFGVAFPLAGTIRAAGRRTVGESVGEVAAFNTAGAILGAAVAGFALIYAFGIERSLQLLVVLNAGIGLMVLGAATGRRALPWAALAGTGGLLVALAVAPGWGRLWDAKFFAVFSNNNNRTIFGTPHKIKDALENVDVLYFFEGANETISVTHPRGGKPAFAVNGRMEASASFMDMQCQRTLGHLPMLLHPNPRKVFVLGTGTGMTLGAVSLHPEAERIVLAEIEPGALGAARQFQAYNHRVLDDPRLRVVFNDGRNYLTTTREQFDVVTADPIHPWSGGAAYLYTAEYFRSVAEHLLPGGIATQWLPIYELTPRDVATVLRTFAESFPHVMIWLTHYDAEIVGSRSPIRVDSAELTRRLGRPAIAADLGEVHMGTAQDFLDYFVAGTEGARAFASLGTVNTDDNLFLEFSAPESIGQGQVMGANVTALARARESLLPYLAPAPAGPERDAQEARWSRSFAAARLYDRAHALFLWGEDRGPEFQRLSGALEREFPAYAPLRFLQRERQEQVGREPRLAGSVRFAVASGPGARRSLEISIVSVRISPTRAAVMVVDNDRREIYGSRYFDGSAEELDGAVPRFTADALAALRAAYDDLTAAVRRSGADLADEAAVAQRLKQRAAELTARP